MADEILRSRHAFGSLDNLQSAIDLGKVDQYDVLFVKDKNDKPQVGWVDKNGTPLIVDTEKVLHVDSLPESGEDGKIYIFNGDGYFWNGKEFVNLCKPTDLSYLESQITELESEVVTKVDAKTVQDMIEKHSESIIEVVEF